MKRIILTVGICTLLSGAAYADGSAFTPLNFNDTSFNPTDVKQQAINAVQDEAVGNSNIQNAISQLDNAQIDMRNDLLNVKTKYADVDAQYKLIKAERSALAKQVRAVEKRIRDIDKAKEKIRKNML